MAFFYRPRIADLELRFCLAAAGAVVIEGPKACGKTLMAKAVFHWRHYLMLNLFSALIQALQLRIWQN